MAITIRTFSNDEALVKERRKHIVQCSMKILAKKGYDRTNMRELAQACDISAGSLYYYFGSKEEILYSIINTATSEQADCIERFASGLRRTNIKAALLRTVRVFFQWHDDNQDITLFIYQETKNLSRDAREHIFESEARILAVFENLLTKGIESGDFTIKDTKLVAHNIIMLVHAWALRRWYLRKHFTFETYVREQSDNILKMIGADTTDTLDL